MEIKFKDNPVTIKTIEIGGKKLTKQFLQQIPLEHYNFNKLDDNENKAYSLKYIYSIKDEERDNYIFNGNIVGYLNVHLEKEENILEWLNGSTFYTAGTIVNAYTILYINIEGELNRGYMHKSTYHKLFDKDYPQIFI